MDKVLILYASMSGNTEAIADLIGEGLRQAGEEAEKLEVLEADADVFSSYSRIILGAYTWGDGELPDDFIDIYEDLQSADLSGKHFGLFGSGDRSYEHFCGAVDTLAERVTEQGGTIVLNPLKIEFNPEGEEEQTCRDFGIQFSEKTL